jgi:hypothetical protein
MNKNNKAEATGHSINFDFGEAFKAAMPRLPCRSFPPDESLKEHRS